MLMKYIKESCNTISKDEICEVVAIKRTNSIWFPSGIMLAFKKADGSTLAWCDRNDWEKINN